MQSFTSCINAIFCAQYEFNTHVISAFIQRELINTILLSKWSFWQIPIAITGIEGRFKWAFHGARKWMFVSPFIFFRNAETHRACVWIDKMSDVTGWRSGDAGVGRGGAGSVVHGRRAVVVALQVLKAERVGHVHGGQLAGRRARQQLGREPARQLVVTTACAARAAHVCEVTCFTHYFCF